MCVVNIFLIKFKIHLWLWKSTMQPNANCLRAFMKKDKKKYMDYNQNKNIGLLWVHLFSFPRVMWRIKDFI